MLKKIVVTNFRNESIEYDIEGVQAENESGLLITSIDGLGPVKATINMTDVPTSDGSVFNSARLNSRNIVIKAKFTSASSIEEARHLSYRYFPVKSKVKMQVVTDTRTAWTEGYVESNEPDIFYEMCGCQISIICPSAYFCNEEAEYEMPANIRYSGDIDSGVVMNFYLHSDSMFDSLSLSKLDILKNDTECMSLDFSKMSSLVPNTMPNNTPSYKCMYIYNADASNEQYKCIRALSNQMMADTCCILQNKIHIISDGKHYVYENGNVKFVDELPHPFICSAVYNNELYVFGSGNNVYSRKFYKWNSSAGWIEQPRLPYPVERSKLYTVYDNKLHIFGGSSSGGYNQNHYTFDGEVWEESVSSPIEIGWGWAVTVPGVFDDYEVHIFHDRFGDPHHSVWNGTNWHDETISFYASSGSGSGTKKYIPGMYDVPIVVGNKIHIFTPVDDEVSDNYKKTHITYSVLNGFSELPNSPKAFYSAAGCYFNDVVYLFGGGGSTDTITESPNNTKLVENDELVIDTIKGEKSVSLNRNGIKYNILNTFVNGSKWLELEHGNNTIAYASYGDNPEATLTTKELFEGA